MRTDFQDAQDIFNKKLILIAEDNAFLRQGYADVFTSLGCNVLTAANGEEALTQFQQNHSDINLIILDLDMPLIKGEEVYRQVYMKAPEMKVIIASACDEKEARDRLDKNQNVPFVHKPFSVSNLVHLARRLLLYTPAYSAKVLEK